MTSAPAQARLTVVPPALPVSLRRRGRTHEQLGLSVEDPSELSLRVNLNTVKAFAVTASLSVLARADEVID
jgi:hypothetical protein